VTWLWRDLLSLLGWGAFLFLACAALYALFLFMDWLAGE
jgi:hypothetical protein